MTQPQPELAAIARQNWPKLKRFFRAKVAEPDCYDLTQDTLLAFVRTDLSQVARPEAYLWRIARNRLFDYFKRKRPTESFESTRMSLAEIGGSLSSVLARRQRLTAALARLPVDQQIAFELRFGEELQLEEIADAMGLSLATVKRYLQKARTQLREILSGPDFAPQAANEHAVIEAYRQA